MKAAVCIQPGRLALEDRPLPDEAEEGWVAVDIAHVGVCGTDYHIFEGKHPFLDYPRVMGHELSGRIARTGGGWTKGDLVVVNPYVSCGTCIACRRGKPNCCVRIGVLGVHRDGGMCERINVPAQNLYPAEGLLPEQAAMVEFMAIGAHAVRRSQLAEGMRALVVGVGPIGLGVALFARLREAEVTLLDRSRHRLETAAERFGFDKSVALDDGGEAVLADTGGEGYDVVFDATGSVKAIEAGLQFVAHGGTYVLVSVVKDVISFSDPEFHKRETTLLGSRNATREDFDRVMEAFRSGAIDHRQLLTHRGRIETVVEDFDRWVRDRDGVIKAVIEVGG